jgi:hypothetical protein
MPVPPQVVTVTDESVIVTTLPAGAPPAPYATWCDWAWDQYRHALEGFGSAAGGVEGYGIGTRWVRYRSPADQAKAVDVLRRQVELYCNILLPAPVGQECAIRIVPRDV